MMLHQMQVTQVFYEIAASSSTFEYVEQSMRRKRTPLVVGSCSSLILRWEDKKRGRMMTVPGTVTSTEL